MKLNGNAVKPGNVIEHNGRLWVAVKVSHVKPGKGGAFAQIELRDIRDGTKLNERFRSSETVERGIFAGWHDRYDVQPRRRADFS